MSKTGHRITDLLIAITGMLCLFVAIELQAGIITAAITSILIGIVALSVYLQQTGPASAIQSWESGFPGSAELLKATGKGGVVVINLPEGEQIIAERGADVLGDIMLHLGEVMEALTAGRTIYLINHSTLAYCCTDDHQRELKLLQGLSPNLLQAMTAGSNGIDLHVHAGICLDTDDDMQRAMARAFVAARRAQVSGMLWQRWCPKGDGVWPLTVYNEFTRALTGGDIWLAYQPKYDAGSNEIVGAEALIRWNHPERGAIAPADFIPIIEKNGQMMELTRFTIEQAIADFSSLPDHWDVAVNIAPGLLGSGRIIAVVTQALQKAGFPASRLVLEVTETASIDERGIAEINHLRSLGIEVAIDDYGVGFSTVSHLRDLPATQLKLDKSLVQQLLNDDKGQKIVLSSIRLAHDMGMKVVAEGAELESQLRFLAGAGCDLIQGFVLAKPMPLKDLERLTLSYEEAKAVA
ncbi:EAL domain-containing protein [Croceicoccus sp. 1NDH52]|nr:EAL domain-containing protein [Croceicoccus gelatinilyticus]